MLFIICLVNIVLGEGNCTNFPLCDTVTQYLMANPGTLSCQSEICDSNDISTCCEQKANCANYSLCDGVEIVANASFVYCAAKLCEEDDAATCCEKGSSRASWNFLMIYLIVLVIGSILGLIGYKCHSSGDSDGSSNSKESNVDKEKDMHITKQIAPDSNDTPQSGVVLQSNEDAVDEEDDDTGRVYLL